MSLMCFISRMQITHSDMLVMLRLHTKLKDDKFARLAVRQP